MANVESCRWTAVQDGKSPLEFISLARNLFYELKLKLPSHAANRNLGNVIPLRQQPQSRHVWHRLQARHYQLRHLRKDPECTLDDMVDMSKRCVSLEIDVIA